jgi:adenine-specific DNA-methyltransferase
MTEYILIYSKNKSSTYLFGGFADENESQPIIKRTNKISVLNIKPNVIKTKLADGTYKKGVYGENVNPVELLNDVVFKNKYNLNEFKIKAPFTWTQDFFDKELKRGSKPIINTLNFQIRVFRVNGDDSFKGFGSLIDGVEIKGTSEDAYEELESLFGFKKIFDYAKPKNLIKELVMASTKFNDNVIILDFFAGSGTTGHAVMQLNAEDGGNRKYILVQLPEPIDPKKNKTAFDFVKNELGIAEPTIFEITKERLVRAGKKIEDTSGFKIYETVNFI